MKDPVILRIFKNEQLIAVKQFEGDQMVVGRNADLPISLDDEHVSPIHAMIEKRDSDYFVSDLGSQSGTFKNAKQVLEEPLNSGDEIQIGPFRLAFFVGIPKTAGVATAGSTVAVRPDGTPPEHPQAPTAPEPTSAPQAADSSQAPPAPSDFERPEDNAPKEEVTGVAQKDVQATQEINDSKEALTAEVKPEAVVPAEAPASQDEPQAPEQAPVAPAPPKPPAQSAQLPPSPPPSIEEDKEGEEAEEVTQPGIGYPNVAAGYRPVSQDIEPSSVGSIQVSLGRPSLRAGQKGKTFAPPSSHKDLGEVIKPSKGSVIEVIVAWQERALQTYHFRAQGVVHAGTDKKAAVQVPASVANQKIFKLLDITSVCEVCIPGAYKAHVTTEEKTIDSDELHRQHRITGEGAGRKIRLEQGELLRLELNDGVVIFVRYVTNSPVAPLAPALPFTASELTGLVIALMLVSLMAIYVAIYSPPDGINLDDEEDVKRIATFVYHRPKVVIPPRPPEPKVVQKPTPPPKPRPQPKPKKVKVDMAKKENTTPKPKVPKITGAPQRVVKQAAAAGEVRPKPDGKKNTFTSVKQGGAKKLGETAGANAQSAKKDVSKIGLFSAFGGKGVREKLDEAYSGAGEILGAADRATGTSGQNADREGGDLGSKFKDTGAGGRGTQTQGIAGVKTRGRSSGQSTYGQAGLGGRESVNIEPGGGGEEFSGGIDREAVRRVIQRNLHHIRACYELELNRTKQQQLEGELELKWEFGAQGRVIGTPQVIKNTLGGPNVANCVVNRLRVWQFPEPPAGMVGVVERYPFVFKRTN